MRTSDLVILISIGVVLTLLSWFARRDLKECISHIKDLEQRVYGCQTKAQAEAASSPVF